MRRCAAQGAVLVNLFGGIHLGRCVDLRCVEPCRSVQLRAEMI